MRTTQSTWHFSDAHGAAFRPLVKPATIASIVGLVALGLFLMIRRTNGALSSPLPPAQLLATVIILLAWSFGVTIIFSSRERPYSWVIRPITVAAVTLFAVACSYPGDRAIDWLVWLPAIVMPAFAPGLIARWRTSNRGVATARAEQQSMPDAQHEGDVTGATDEEDQLLQEVRRFRTVEGGEVIHAKLAAEFPPGVRCTTLYLAFCPPFEYLPDVEANIVEGPDAHVKVAQLLQNGAQLEVQLSRSHSTPQRVLIEVLAAGQPLAT